MCTVTFLPDSEGGFILTSNRDEKLIREKAEIPEVRLIENQKILFPRDPKAGGTWIAVSEKGRAVCLLNGASEPHIPSPPYRKSRGQVVLDSFQFENIHDFIKDYSLSGIEPFTCILIEGDDLMELRWDGNEKQLTSKNIITPALWASVTLYPGAVREKRKQWFEEWLTYEDNTVEGIRKFHRFAGEGDERNDLVINRDNEMLTQSITSIVYPPGKQPQMIYEDLLENKSYVSCF